VECRRAFGSAIRRGQILDVLDPRVAAHPERFEWIARPDKLEDIERLTREERDGKEAA
jgi:hypothetical protein